jgi:hypothetical protein
MLHNILEIQYVSTFHGISSYDKLLILNVSLVSQVLGCLPSIFIFFNPQKN